MFVTFKEWIIIFEKKILNPIKLDLLSLGKRLSSGSSSMTRADCLSLPAS
jgi:hypothetical protein